MSLQKLTGVALAAAASLTTLVAQAGFVDCDDCLPAAVPEPGALALLAGVIAAAGTIRALRRRK